MQKLLRQQELIMTTDENECPFQMFPRKNPADADDWHANERLL